MYKLFIIPVLCGVTAFGQTTPPGPKILIQTDNLAPFGPEGITTALAGPMTNITGAPYSAQSTTERVQVLADGNRIVQTTSGLVARDSQGRVRREESLPGVKTSEGEAPHIVMIDDPVAQVHWTLDAQTKTAVKMPLPNIKGGPFGVVAGSGITSTNKFFFIGNPGSLGPPTLSSTMIFKDSSSPNDPKPTKTDLGTQTVEGVAAQGTRTTRTIPAGQFGNEQPMTITTETWYSPDLKVLVMSKSTDPRMGNTTYTLTNIQRTQPAPALFQVPDDYTVREANLPPLPTSIPKEQ